MLLYYYVILANAQPRPQYHYHQGFSSQGNQPVPNSHSHASNYPVVNTQYPPYNSTSYQTPFTYGQNDEQSRLTPMQGQGSTALVSTQGQGQIASPERFPCPHCTKTFTRNFDRKRHMEIHIPGAGGINRCQFCHKDYSRSDSLKRHLDNGCEKKPRP